MASRQSVWLLGITLAGSLSANGFLALKMFGPNTSFPRRPYAEERRTLFEELAVRSDSIVLLGDSLTDRGEWQELLNRDDVGNRGIAGDTTLDVLARLEPLLKPAPSMVLLMVGINDLEAGRSTSQVLDGIEEIVQRIRSASASTRILVQSILPVHEGLHDGVATNERIAEINTALPAVAARHAAEHMDVASALTNVGGQLDEAFTIDGVHLTGAGYRKWAALLASRL